MIKLVYEVSSLSCSILIYIFSLPTWFMSCVHSRPCLRFFKNGPFPGSFFFSMHFIKQLIVNKIGFELRISDFRSDRCTNCGATTARVCVCLFFVSDVDWHVSCFGTVLSCLLSESHNSFCHCQKSSALVILLIDTKNSDTQNVGINHELVWDKRD